MLMADNLDGLGLKRRICTPRWFLRFRLDSLHSYISVDRQ